MTKADQPEVVVSATEVVSVSRHIEEYGVVSSYEAKDLVQQVESWIHEGWQPWGSMSALLVAEKFRDPGNKFFQPMVKWSSE